MANLDPATNWPFPEPEKKQHLGYEVYDLVEHYFDHDGPMCEGCEFFSQWAELMGEYQGQPARQILTQCLLLENGGVHLCPALDELIEQAKI